MNIIKTAILLSYISVASLSAAIITPALPTIQAEFQLNTGSLAWVITLFLIGYMLGQLIYGPLANRFGRLVALRLGLGINLVGIAICLIALPLHSYTILLIGRLVTALGAAAGLSCTFMLIHALFEPHEAKTTISFAVVSFTLGIGLAVLVGGLITQYLQWQDCFWFLMLHGILTFISTWLFTDPPMDKKPISVSTLWHGYRHVLKKRTLVVFSSLLGLVSVISYTFSAEAPLIAHHLLHLSAADYGYWNMVNMLGMLSGGLSAAWVLKRYDTHKVLYIALTCIALSLLSLIILSLTQSQSALWFFLSVAVMYFFASWVFPSASFLASHASDDKASASSMMSFINMGAAVISVWVMGYLPLTALNAFILTVSAYLLLVLAFYGCSKHRL